MRLVSGLLTAFCLLAAPAATAHEFWLSPETYRIEPGETIDVRLRVGEKLKGPSYVYRESSFERFDVISPQGRAPVEGRIGDDPALSAVMEGEGLVVVIHETTDNKLTYRDWQKFLNFVEHKDFQTALSEHAARGLPETGFVESYRRYAKSLLAVGTADGADQITGLRTEIVALENPYTTNLGELPVLVLLDGAPRADAQVEIFQKGPDGEVAIALTRTDTDGRAMVPLAPGTEYLIDAVVLESTGNDDPEAGPVWHSLWASLTFKTD